MKNTRRNLIMNLLLNSIPILAGINLILLLASLALLDGQIQDCVPTAYQTPLLMDTFYESFEEKIESVVLVYRSRMEEMAPRIHRVTAYCACAKCCGSWALNRPNGIVYGAAGIELESGVSCASTLPFGTVISVYGYGDVVVHDRMAKWVTDKYGDDCIDIYFGSHEEAAAFGLQYMYATVNNQI